MDRSDRNQRGFTCTAQIIETFLAPQIHTYSGRRGGTVYLVGAGPGDPGLLTVRGAELLAVAEVVVYDALANPLLLKRCPQAHTIYVGKRAGSHSMSQEQINQVLVEHALAGKMVVRLKGGDPFIFGRGGEEAEAVLAAGLRFEVVPGITAAIAAPAYAGIPVTHRDFNSSFTFVTGHEKSESKENSMNATLNTQRSTLNVEVEVDWGAVARLPCVAFYMGMKTLGGICDRLMENGMAADTPAAVIQWGTTPQQRTIVSSLREIAGKVVEAKMGAPAIVIVGKVVSLRERLNWFERRPLFGRTILVTRSRDQVSELAGQLMELGARVLEQPTIELVAGADTAVVNHLLLGAAEKKYDWIIFTSANGVIHTKRRLFELKLDVRAFGSAKVAAVGEATATAIAEKLGLRVELCPEEFLAEALGNALAGAAEIAGKRFLLLRADIGRPVLVKMLKENGAGVVDDAAIYENRPVTQLDSAVQQAVVADEIDWITFTSSSTATNLLRMLNPLPSRAKLASIGPMTSQTLRAAGYDPVEAGQHDIAGLVQAILSTEAAAGGVT